MEGVNNGKANANANNKKATKTEKRSSILNNIRQRAKNGAHTQKNRSQVALKVRVFEERIKKLSDEGKSLPAYQQERYDEAKGVLRLMTGEESPKVMPKVTPKETQTVMPKETRKATAAKTAMLANVGKASPVFPIAPPTSPANGAANGGPISLNFSTAKLPTAKLPTRKKRNTPAQADPLLFTAPPSSPVEQGQLVNLPIFSPPAQLAPMTLKKRKAEASKVEFNPPPKSPAASQLPFGEYANNGTFKQAGTVAANGQTTSNSIDFKRFLTSRAKIPNAAKGKSRGLIYNSFLEKASQMQMSALPWGGSDPEHQLFNPFSGTEYKVEDNPLPDIERAHFKLQDFLKMVHRKAATLRRASTKRASTKRSSRGSKGSRRESGSN